MLNTVKISRDLFNKTLALLEDLDVDDFLPETIQLYGYISHAFNAIKLDMALRDDFYSFVNARNSDHAYFNKPF